MTGSLVMANLFAFKCSECGVQSPVRAAACLEWQSGGPLGMAGFSCRVDGPGARLDAHRNSTHHKRQQHFMNKFFRNRTLAVGLRMSSMTTRLGVLTGLMAGLTFSAQAQA